MKFKIGDRVNVKEWEAPPGRPEDGVIFGPLSSVGTYPVEFRGWRSGHDADAEDGAQNRWFVDKDNLELALMPPAVFHVIYIEDDDETFDTREEAEAHAEDLAAEEPGTKVAVLKVVSTTTLDIAVERFE